MRIFGIGESEIEMGRDAAFVTHVPNFQDTTLSGAFGSLAGSLAGPA